MHPQVLSAGRFGFVTEVTNRTRLSFAFAIGRQEQYADAICCGAIRMGFLGQLTNLFSRSGRDDNRLRQGMEHAHAKRPAQAIAIYDSLVNSKGTSPTLRARALFNRALAHSSMKDDQQAIVDLEAVVAMPSAPENVLASARNQLVRVRNRIQRVHDRAERDAEQ